MLLQGQHNAVCDNGGQDHVLKRSESVKEILWKADSKDQYIKAHQKWKNKLLKTLLETYVLDLSCIFLTNVKDTTCNIHNCFHNHKKIKGLLSIIPGEMHGFGEPTDSNRPECIAA